MPPLDRHLHWLIAIRLVVVTSVVVPYFLLSTLAPGEPVLAPAGVESPSPAPTEPCRGSGRPSMPPC